VSLFSLPPGGGHPAGFPELFVDRSLGRAQVPQILRAAGLRLVMLAEHYGRPADESVTDVEWLEEAGRRDLGGDKG
jgi:PIN like domain